MTVIPGNYLFSRNFCFHPFSRAAIFEHFFFRQYSCPRIRVKMHEAHIDYNEADERFMCTLHYANPSLKVDRTFNFVRTANESVQHFLKRVDASIRTVAFKKVQKRKQSETSLSNIINKDNVKSDKIVIIKGKVELDGELPCSEFLNSSEPVKLYIFGEEYKFKYNVPKINSITLSDYIIANFPTYPMKIETKNMCQEKSSFTWFRSDQVKNKLEWVQVGTGYVHTPTEAEVGSKLKLLCEPKSDQDIGASVEIISNESVIASPDHLPFERRHGYTKDKLSDDKFRVVTYNILADMYSDSTYSKNVLFPYCPEYALRMDYRKNFIMKELMGFNADIICLQEVDKKVFARDLNIVLALSNYRGIYNNKPNVEEGLAIFFNESRFTLLSNECSLMSENTSSLSDFKEVWTSLQNEKTKLSFLQRPNIVQAVVLQSKEDPSKLILVGNTHLYFHPIADNIRLLQAYYAVTYLRKKAEEIKRKHPEATMSLVFCGDFNSSPQDGIFKLFTCNYLPADSADWKTQTLVTDIRNQQKDIMSLKKHENVKKAQSSLMTHIKDMFLNYVVINEIDTIQGTRFSNKGQEDVVEGISLRQDFRFGSACGTPKYTNFTTIFSGCLDYIFYDQENLAVEQSVPLPTEEELVEHTAIPSLVFPSDHISLCADLKWLK